LHLPELPCRIPDGPDGPVTIYNSENRGIPFGGGVKWAFHRIYDLRAGR
jgi:hypothetical protein